MPAAYQNLYLEQGTTFSITVNIDDVYGDTFDLSGFSANSQIRKSYYSANATATFVTTIDGVNGRITLDLSAEQTANISAGRYVYDTIISANNGVNTTVTRILEGIIDVSPRVTR
jgi:hypothetical protein